MADARNAGPSTNDDATDVAATEGGFSAGASSGAAMRERTEKLAEQTQEGIRQASAATAAGADAAVRSGSAMTQGMQDLAAAWVHYGEEVMRQTADASRALMSCRSLPEMIEVQARLLRGNLQAFLDQSTKISEIAGRIAARPFEAVREAGAGQPRP